MWWKGPWSWLCFCSQFLVKSPNICKKIYCVVIFASAILGLVCKNLQLYLLFFLNNLTEGAWNFFILFSENSDQWSKIEISCFQLVCCHCSWFVVAIVGALDLWYDFWVSLDMMLLLYHQSAIGTTCENLKTVPLCSSLKVQRQCVFVRRVVLGSSSYTRFIIKFYLHEVSELKVCFIGGLYDFSA